MKCPDDQCSYLHTPISLDRERIILSEQDTASKPIRARPGRSPLTYHPKPTAGLEAARWPSNEHGGLKRQIASGGRVLVARPR